MRLVARMDYQIKTKTEKETLGRFSLEAHRWTRWNPLLD